MSLVFSAITPHPPILIPTIGKDNLEQIKSTKEAMEKLADELAQTEAEILIIISPHGQIDHVAFTVNISENYEVNFESFGDFATKLNIKGETILMAAGKEQISKKSPLNIISEPKLDHGVGVPLFYLSQKLGDFSLIPIYFSLLDTQAQVEFGKGLKEIIMASDKKVAVVASGDLSHCLTENAPAPFNPAGKEFDEKLIALLKNNDSQSIINLDQTLTENAAECGLRSILILLGVLNNVNFNTEILSYEAPFGVGYLVANLKLE